MKISFFYGLLMVCVFALGNQIGLAQSEENQSDTFQTTDSSIVTPMVEEGDESQEEEATVDPEEEDSDSSSTVLNNKYKELLAKATDTIYPKASIQTGSVFDKTKWKAATKSFDFTETPPKKKEDKAKPLTPLKGPSWDFSAWAGPLKYGSLLLLIGLMLYIIYQIMKQYWTEKEINREDLFSWEANPDKISYNKLEDLLDGYLTDKNYTQALRILFLLVLKDLSTMELIAWRKNKTNIQYLRELKNQHLHLPYRRLSTAFDAARYGNYTVTETTFAQVKLHFDSIQSILKPPTTV